MALGPKRRRGDKSVEATLTTLGGALAVTLLLMVLLIPGIAVDCCRGCTALAFRVHTHSDDSHRVLQCPQESQTVRSENGHRRQGEALTQLLQLEGMRLAVGTASLTNTTDHRKRRGLVAKT